MYINNLNFLYLSLLAIYYDRFGNCYTETKKYVSTERPAVDWFDKTVFKNVSYFNRRSNRQDPMYYGELYVNTLIPLNNNVQMNFFFYQFLTNRYRPSFVELHFGFCNLLENDTIFGPTLKRALGNKTCPLPPGEYDFKDLYIPYVPNGFPFTKGRIYLNVSLHSGSTSKLIARGRIDMEIKAMKFVKKT